MTPFATRLNPSSDDFSANREKQLALLDRLEALMTRAATKSEERRARFEERGQLTPRERLARLLDPGMPFLTLFPLANYLVDKADPESSLAGASALAGIGFVSGTRVMVLVDDSGIAAGAMTEKSLDKVLNCLDMARDLKLPFVHCVESAGADLKNYRVELWAHGGAVFAKLARLSAAGIPTFTILHGPSTAGGAYMPGLSDYVIAVEGRGRAALASAALVRAATGEVVEEEPLSGARMHAEVSGLVEYLADDDAHALRLARKLVGQLGWNRSVRSTLEADHDGFREPVFHPEEILGLIPRDYRTPYDVRELVVRIVDGSEFVDFKPDYGISTICMQAEVMGRPVSILGNNGPIDPDGATKAAQFIQLADQSETPLVFLNNTTGYIVGEAAERAGMIKHGSKMIQAVANARVPKITFYVGGSFGAGNYGMCGLGFDPDFLFAYPQSVSGVMGGMQAAKTMSQVMAGAAKRRGHELDPKAVAAQEAMLAEHFDKQSDAFYTSGRMLDMGIIDPRKTRHVLGFALETLSEAAARTLKPNAFGVARM
ncbi:MAG: carboxyl transferase domain-containing protein [Pseudomonadota bacterium]